MEEAKCDPNSTLNPSPGFHWFTAFFLVVASWILIHRLSQRNRKGPKTWPLIGATIEQLKNYERMHDWLVDYLAKHKTIHVSMPFNSYTYIADPMNVEHILKTNFSNYPKVIRLLCC
jgi:long-chain fatty acid omega-monooxygenase